MDKDKKILDEVKKTISLLDHVRNIEPNPYLYTRIKAHIDSKNYDSKSTNANTVFNYSKRLIFTLLILFNIYTIIIFLTTDKQTSAAREQYINNIKSEYFFNYDVDYLANLNKEE